MAISPAIARVILQEHRYKPISGDVWLVGRQSMILTVEEAVRVCTDEGVPVRAEFDPNDTRLIDRTTRSSAGKEFITDAGFFSIFTNARVRALDVSHYEGADIVHDMNEPIPKEMEASADFLFNGSCLDNMSDPMTGLQNAMRMLRPMGRMITMEMATTGFNAYMTFSPAFFFDWYALNRVADCKLYICAVYRDGILTGPWHFYAPTTADLGEVQLHRFPRRTSVLTLAVVEAGSDTTSDRKPIQGQYRSEHGVFRDAFERFASSPRPQLKMQHTLERFVGPRHLKDKLLFRRLGRAPKRLRNYVYLGEM